MTEDVNNRAAQELLSRLGQRLKAEREARGLNIQEIAGQTRINPAFIAKIEAGDIEGLPALTFVRGFIRNYLQVLQLEDPEIEAGLARFSGLEEARSDISLGARITRMQGEEPESALPYQKTVLIGIAALLVIWGGYMLFRVFSAPDDQARPQVAATQDATESPGEPEPAAKPEKKAPPPKPAEAPTAGKPPEAPPPAAAQNRGGVTQPPGPPRLEPTQGLRLTVRGLEPTWLRISVDRAPPMEVLVEPAETLNWDANEEIRLVIGKSQGVAVYLNGEDILLPAERDRLIPRIVLNKLTLLRLEN